jgi:geranylgeranyl pyrophosphate synthase
MISQKTGSLYAAACQVGAHYAGGDARQVQALWAFGRDIGVAFEILHDCLELTGDQDVVDRPPGTTGVRRLTLPVLQLLEHSGDQRGRVLQLVGSGDPSSASACSLRAEFDVDAAVTAALTQARRWTERGRKTLQTLPEGPARDAMIDLLDYV